MIASHHHPFLASPSTSVTQEGRNTPLQVVYQARSVYQVEYATKVHQELITQSTNSDPRPDALRNDDSSKHLLSLVQNPVQNPNTTPSTIANCSNDINDPRNSGGLISAMYNGDNMLSAPIPMPPIVRPRMRSSSEEASVCMAEPMINTTTRYVDPNLGGCMFSSRWYCVVKEN